MNGKMECILNQSTLDRLRREADYLNRHSSTITVNILTFKALIEAAQGNIQHPTSNDNRRNPEHNA